MVTTGTYQGRLDDDAAVAVIAAHIDTCAECRSKLETMSADTLERLVRSADTTPVVPAPPPLPPQALIDPPRY